MCNKKQELSDEVLQKLERMRQEVIDEMVKEDWDIKKAEQQAKAFF